MILPKLLPSPYIVQEEGNCPKDERVTMIMALEVRSDLGIKLSDLNYPDIHVHVAYNNHFGGL